MAILVIVACGGTATTATPTPVVGPTSAPATDAPATDAPATDEPATDAPTTVEPATEPPAGGPSDVCALVTVEEWANVTGLNASAAETIPMDEHFAGCIYTDADGAVGALNVSPNGGMWDIVWKVSGLPEVAGIGDGAVWEESTASLVVLVGDRILAVNAGTGADELADRLEWAKQLAVIALSRW